VREKRRRVSEERNRRERRRNLEEMVRTCAWKTSTLTKI
jgi:hypothetical protein